ncbi:MAG: hypothetical protein LH613_12860 [Chamaesiphon sp.]|nr:hypothetical protein [Chamaesiphon sp.]
MFKLLLGTLLATAPLGLASATQAQLPPASPSPIPSQSQPQPAASPTPSQSQPPSLQPAATAPDLTLLGKVLGAFLKTNRVSTESQIVMTVPDKGADFKIYARSKTIAQSSGEFRSEVTFARPGQPPTATYTIVSDRRRVWIYRPDRRQYSQTTIAKFQAQPYSYLVGISSIFFLTLTEPARRELNTALASSPNFLAGLPERDIKDLQGSRQQVEGQDLYVYSYTNKLENWTFNSFVQPQTGILKQVEFTGALDPKDGGSNFTLTEKIIDRRPQPTVNSSIFKFLPPKGTKKVQSLSIDLTGL